MQPSITLSRSPRSLAPIDDTNELRRRMARPQRHRLLHGYPMAPLLTPVSGEPWATITPDDDRPIIVGVLPHTFCNPTVRGCGFCTFPHERYSNAAARDVALQVAREVRRTPFRARRVDALYFGGGTANLIPPDAFAPLARALEETFDLRGAEITLEGVATYFDPPARSPRPRDPALLDILARVRARHRRLSVGVQTFDREWLARMGRTAFGAEDDFATLVTAAHARGMTISCDLLFNLPGQSVSASLGDVGTAIALGFDQICLYNLVLQPDLDSAWAKTSLVDRLARPEDACATWLALRDRLLREGFVQTTLTNFERGALHATSRRFVYEEHSFDPATYDGIGFGPGAISTLTERDSLRGVKWMNEGRSAAYVERMDRDRAASARAFDYSPDDVELLHLTRSLARLRVAREPFRARFGRDPVRAFAGPIDALVREELIVVDETAIELTPRGMFYADSVVGLLAARRAAELRHANDAAAHAMG
jgi:oxygen-independent coproporphyrinogen-3 oxidase